MTKPDSGLPDPRRYGAGEGHALNLLAADELQRELHKVLKGGRDAEIAAALAAAPSHAAYASLWQAVCDAASAGSVEVGDAHSAIEVRVFALPLVIVTGSRRPVSLPGVIPDIAAVHGLLEQHGALGRTRNLGISNALCSYTTLSQVKPSEVYAWTAAGTAQRELPPCAIEVAQPGEHVHLRFLVGAAVTPTAEPSFIQAASNIATWGMPLTRALAAQMSQPGVEVLPLPRAPLDLLRAVHTGRAAQLEAALNLFVSNAVRQFRSVSGDPRAEISAHDNADVRVRINQPFDDTALESFNWPLDPLDDLAAIVRLVTDLLASCQLADVRIVDAIKPAVQDGANPESDLTMHNVPLALWKH